MRLIHSFAWSQTTSELNSWLKMRNTRKILSINCVLSCLAGRAVSVSMTELRSMQTTLNNCWWPLSTRRKRKNDFATFSSSRSCALKCRSIPQWRKIYKSARISRKKWRASKPKENASATPTLQSCAPTAKTTWTRWRETSTAPSWKKKTRSTSSTGRTSRGCPVPRSRSSTISSKWPDYKLSRRVLCCGGLLTRWRRRTARLKSNLTGLGRQMRRLAVKSL